MEEVKRQLALRKKMKSREIGPPGPACNLMLYYGSDEKPYLKERKSPFLKSDDDDRWKSRKGLYSEVNFTNVNQEVEKSWNDLHGTMQVSKGTHSDLHFCGKLYNFNLPMIKNSWVNTQEDLLKLPIP